MKSLKTLNKWANYHTNYGMDTLRILLGLFLFIKGVDFINQTEHITELIAPLGSFGSTMILVHYIAMGHLLGGILVMLGLLTRLALLIQIPILFGAIAINFLGVFDGGNLWQALITMLAALFFVVYGSGKHSLDYNFKLEM